MMHSGVAQIRTNTQRALLYFCIFLGAFLALSIPHAAQALTPQASPVAGARLYTFPKDSGCANPKELNDHVLIVPNSTEQIDRVYLHFHGLVDGNDTSPANLCNGYHKLCKSVDALASSENINAAIIVPRMDKASTPDISEEFSGGQLSCFLNKAKAELGTLGRGLGNSFYISGHSAGGKSILKATQTGASFNGKSPSQLILLDACYGDWCTEIGNNFSNKINIYFGEDNTKTGSEAAYTAHGSKIRLLQLGENMHYTIPHLCYSDHQSKDKCGGAATLPGGTNPSGALSSGKLPIGAECFDDDNSACASGDCEKSTKVDPATGKNMWFCDCDGVFGESEDCAAQYGKSPGQQWQCKDGLAESWEIDYCIDNNNSVRFAIPPSINKDEIFAKYTSAIFDPEAFVVANELTRITEVPQVRIRIPGLTFSEADEIGIEQDTDGRTFLYFPFLGEYIAAVYQYGVIVASVLAILMVLFGGIQWIISGGEQERITSAKKHITGALVGLLIAVTSYVFLNTLNPELVNFRNLRVFKVKTIPIEALYPEGETNPSTQGYVGGNPTPKGNEKCLYDTFTPGVKIGEKPKTTRVNMFGVGTALVNIRSAEAWQRVSDEAQSSADPEVIGYIQYMIDFKNKLVPDLVGSKDGAGTIQFNLGKGIGVSRHDGSKLSKLNADMHTMGLALDFMTRSNWDINWGGTTRGRPAIEYCPKYKRTLEKMKNGEYGAELVTDPYHMFDRLEKKIENCLDPKKFEKDPYTSIPQGIIDIFERNGFYWAGYGWGNKRRSDSMHFEYWGECMNKKNSGTLNLGGPSVDASTAVYCCSIAGSGVDQSVTSVAECTGFGGTITSSGAC